MSSTIAELQQPLTARALRVYASWQKRFPSFDSGAYARWVEQRGYYRNALDPSKPDFYEYAAVFLSKYQPQRG